MVMIGINIAVGMLGFEIGFNHIACRRPPMRAHIVTSIINFHDVWLNTGEKVS